ncbi:flagellar motor switch protein FliG [Vibrio sp. SS-MA-C1-2]|uniref:FliG C-terminal domain-containing protein n=1 Tax=Vibrio sp. SS-MA-C1-2 TaxID=2908646 RepID=UPI001F29804A|nr:FliG C-terminal domain-containing protein [Vibrio sp. SS-MA-C1-2]UJF18030.1 flagellar motor switch protein FliG [Vibrio sp. SS-MA-C1-2]
MSEDNKGYQNVHGVALMILTMGEDIGSKVMQGFSHEEIKRITHAMSDMTDIKASDAHLSLTRFFDDFRKHSGILGGTRNYITNMLEKTLNGNLAKDLVSEIYGDEIRAEAEKLAWIPADLLVSNLKKEHITMQALVIAHLPLDYAPKVLKEYSTEECNKLIYLISKTEILTASLVDSVKELIAKCQSSYRASTTFSLHGSEIVANLINRYPGDKASLFDYIHEQDESAAGAIEEAMFDFNSLFNQGLETFNEINKEVTIEMWALALKGIDDTRRNFIFNTYPTRTANALKEQIDMLGAVTVSVVEEARKDILEIVRDMQADGQIKIDFTNEQRLL